MSLKVHSCFGAKGEAGRKRDDPDSWTRVGKHGFSPWKNTNRLEEHAIRAWPLTVVLLVEVCRRLEEALQEGGVDLLHGQVLDAVHRPVHVVADALNGGGSFSFIDLLLCIAKVIMLGFESRQCLQNFRCRHKIILLLVFCLSFCRHFSTQKYKINVLFSLLFRVIYLSPSLMIHFPSWNRTYNP